MVPEGIERVEFRIVCHIGLVYLDSICAYKSSDKVLDTSSKKCREQTSSQWMDLSLSESIIAAQVDMAKFQGPLNLKNRV